MTKNTTLNSARIAANFAGTIMGAGFASGQELTQFFVVYGSLGLAGLVVTCVLFAWLGIQILEISYQRKATSYHELLYAVCGEKVGLLLDLLISIFLFGVLTVTLAGAGTLCRDTFGLPYALGLALMTCGLLLTTLYGLQGITTVNLIITPLVTLTVVIIGLYSLFHHELDLSIIHFAPQTQGLPAPHWLLASLLYLSYNLVMSTTVLVPLASAIPQRLARIAGSIAGGVLLLLLAGLITLVVIIHYPQSLAYEIPMLFVASSQHLVQHTSYIFVFAAALYTTGLASLYGCATKLSATTGLSAKTSLVLLLFFSLTLSTAGFSHLIGIIFPVFGYATLWFTCKLLYLSFFAK